MPVKINKEKKLGTIIDLNEGSLKRNKSLRTFEGKGRKTPFLSKIISLSFLSLLFLFLVKYTYVGYMQYICIDDIGMASMSFPTCNISN